MGWFSDAFSDTFNPGQRYHKAAGRSLGRAEFKGGDITTAGGLSGGFSFGADGTLQSTQSLGQFAPLFQRLLRQSEDYFSRAES